MVQKVAAYCRVSTDKDDQLNSLEYQTYYFEELVKSRDDYELHNIYADRGITATSWNKREQFKNMLIDAGLDIDIFKNEPRLSLSKREPLFNRILVKDVSRFTRNINAMEIISKLKQKGVYVDFSTANLTTETLENDVMLGILMLLAEQESKDKSTKVMFGQRRGAEKGVIMTADVFYGYKYHKESNTLEVIPEEAEVVKLIFSLYLSGLGFRRIINELNERGVKTRKGRPFAQQTIRRMLGNHAYKGWLVRNKLEAPAVFSGKTTASMKPESEWLIHKDRIPSIINDDDFDRVQEIRKGKVNHMTKKGVKNAVSKYAGKIICSKCGNNYVRNKETSTQKYYYKCGLKKREGVSACNSPNLYEYEIDSVLERISSVDFSQVFDQHKNTIIGLLSESVKKPLLARIDTESEDIVRSKQNELLVATSKKHRLAELYLEGSFDTEHLKNLAKGIDDDLVRLRREVEELSRSNDEIMAEIREIDKTIQEIETARFREGTEIDTIQLIKTIYVFGGKKRGNRIKPTLSINFRFTELIRKHTSGLCGERYADFLDFLDRANAGGIYET